MSIANKFRSAFRGDVSLFTLVKEVLRRRKAAAKREHERRDLIKITNAPARLAPMYASMSPADLLAHFRAKPPALFMLDGIGDSSRRLFPNYTAKLLETAARIVENSVWELAGFGPLEFTRENIWRRDPLGEKDWGLDFHADVAVYSGDEADIRVLWELNRFGHAVTLACAFAVSEDARYAETFFQQVKVWMEQNPYGRGANWNCAMETALRAMNVLAAFDVFRRSKACTEERLSMVLQFFDQHGRFTLDNNEFSFLATSNHYLSDVVGLFWIGAMVPELEYAAPWREFGLSEILLEIDKQVLPDGADFEASTGYHNFVTQMLLFTFLLARKDGIDIPSEYWQKLRSMVEYTHGIARSDGRTPLIGDADGSQIAPIVKRDSDDEAYLLALGAVVFEEPRFKEFAELAPELLWLLGEGAVDKFRSVAIENTTGSLAFPHAGSYVMRDGDLYLHLNTNDTGTNGRGSHAHNDALSIEVSAYGRPFIIDPGSYVYNLDRKARHLFRSTAVHSTVMIDGEEQSTTLADLPFVLGDQARPRVTAWASDKHHDFVLAEHFGYKRLSKPVLHRRSIEFDKTDRCWVLKDELTGSGKHEICVSFHLAPGVSVESMRANAVRLFDSEGRNLLLAIAGLTADFNVVPSAVSRNYGHREDSSMIQWRSKTELPWNASFIIVPAGRTENLDARLELLNRLADNIDS